MWAGHTSVWSVLRVTMCVSPSGVVDFQDLTRGFAGMSVPAVLTVSIGTLQLLAEATSLQSFPFAFFMVLTNAKVFPRVSRSQTFAFLSYPTRL